ncbi:TPA: hypothetical protein DCG35_01050, partial [Candidatus Edwardsbacteria bacterium]|nr:hypothetical protein [Candidatus Edwardsbacteria bacterium]
FTAGDRQANRLVNAVGVSKTLGGRKLFGPLDIALRPGDKLGLIGANGSGKTTLLKILAGQAQPDSGTVKLADGLRVAVFDQHRDQLNLDLTLRRALCHAGEHVEYKGNFIHINSWANRFLFRPGAAGFPAGAALWRGAVARADSRADAPTGRPAAARRAYQRPGHPVAGGAGEQSAGFPGRAGAGDPRPLYHRPGGGHHRRGGRPGAKDLSRQLFRISV